MEADRERVDPLQAGWEALARHAWHEAHRAFEVALSREENAAALEGLGAAAAWLDEATLAFSARERAYRAFLAQDEPHGAARVAIALAKDSFTFRGEKAIANGWLQRARRLLNGMALNEQVGWLALCHAHIAVYEFDPLPALHHSAEALAVGRQLGDIDLQMLALAYRGLALVFQGEIDEGMTCLDEATTAVVAGEMTHLDASCTTCCCLIYACEQVRDYERAAQWCERLRALATRGDHHAMFSQCRTYYGSILMRQGGWARAEAELAEATRTMEVERPAQAADGLVRLALLYCWQGRVDEAERLLDRAESPPFRALAGYLYLLGRASLALVQGDARRAIDLAERYLRVLPAEAHLTQLLALELLISAHLTLDELARARRRLDEFRILAAPVATRPMHGALRFHEGLVAAAGGELEEARRALEDAVELWSQSGSPVEVAQARSELAGVLARLGRGAAAEREAGAALARLEAVGAGPAAERVASLLRRLRGRSEATPPERAPLTPRQLDVLRLVAEGLSNREIAERLLLSEHTVHRHLSNILTRLDLPSRAAAVAYAARHDLL